ncbi:MULTISPECIES: thiamine phosphate synthase [unclassified Mesobacillus]|uniref:thiamine phosphate synthase n=1 Tax=unclassified Mesobacillus TaxID=2675270 RepID=UPI0020421451|nr:MULTISPECIES: thiamine phosphate synthase [unclassified Mesobacillus]MCM3124624.1 thiamine phosphate synthase [Mesobacillus sp. MER 33]MCM3234666.1 thiamine phosphate synthase [Mesobacillus sp. MER 48]
MSRICPEKMRSLLKIYFIAGSTNCLQDPVTVLEAAIRGGITIFQYREKGEGSLCDLEKQKLGKRLRKICKENDIPFIVNDDIELALELDADGVHIGQEDEDAAQVRRKIGDRILGVSVHNLEEAEKAKQAGADYFGVGPVFPTATKTDTRAVQGTAMIEELKDFGVPIVGIGGINADNAKLVMTAGADGVSVITAISQAEDVKEAAARLRDKIQGGKI